MRPAFPQSEEVKAVFLMVITAPLYQICFTIGILSSESYTQKCQISAVLLINNNHPANTHSKLTRTGTYHSFVPPCPLLGKQATDLALKLSPLVLLW